MKALITGGAGFIGCNLTDRLFTQKQSVTIFDNLSRPGTPQNIAWLRERHPNQVHLIEGDVRDVQLVARACQGVDIIYHLAAQTAVTTSVKDPRTDFEINALGTLNVLEAARTCGSNPIVIFASTNKVYGQLENITTEKQATRYVYKDRLYGVDETQMLDFHSPYGCSKGAADQYVRDYARIYGLRTVVFRQSCIYGPRQFGIEDQGWVAWFIISSVLGNRITIYGDGRQVRDLLHINDLLDAFEVARAKIEISAGQVYNIGGGYDNSLSIWLEFGPLLEELLGQTIEIYYADWRLGDQRVYISNCQKAINDLRWQPRIGIREGIKDLIAWVKCNRSLFEEVFC
ncbi:MAG: NAD-dependent epimerase/dehydratase family protein [Thermodesulfobacteriota bacterium]